MAMQTPKLSPLNGEHKAILDRVLQSCGDLAEFLDACDGCRLDVKEAKERMRAQKEFCESVKRNFFPEST